MIMQLFTECDLFIISAVLVVIYKCCVFRDLTGVLFEMQVSS